MATMRSKKSLPVDGDVALAQPNPDGPLGVEAMLGDLRTRIQNCELMPGERLKFEDLRLHYRASIGSLREILSTLESEGIVSSEKNKGFQVAPVSARELLDLTELRIDLERKALRQSIDAGGDAWESDVVAKWHLLSLLEPKRVDAQEFDPVWAQRHRAFHFALLSACPSEWTLRFCWQLMELLHRYHCLSIRYRRISRAGRGFAGHKQLMRLALERNADKACELLEEHLRATADSILKAVPDFSGERATEQSPRKEPA